MLKQALGSFYFEKAPTGGVITLPFYFIPATRVPLPTASSHSTQRIRICGDVLNLIRNGPGQPALAHLKQWGWIRWSPRLRRLGAQIP